MIPLNIHKIHHFQYHPILVILLTRIEINFTIQMYIKYVKLHNQYYYRKRIHN